MHLRSFQKTDLDQLFAIDQVCFVEGIAYSKAELRYFLSHPTAFAIVAEDERLGIAGFCIAQHELQRGRPVGHIITIDVLPAARRRGIGRALMHSMDEHFRSTSVEKVRLEVAVDNLEAQAFYQGFGFEVIGHIPGYYLGSLDALVMEKQLFSVARE
jgi:[ribosomal protein S18]-alanine N-acetyltransferase